MMLIVGIVTRIFGDDNTSYLFDVRRTSMKCGPAAPFKGGRLCVRGGRRIEFLWQPMNSGIECRY
jgi:hypothetical protein